jgi:hypothetical protein
LVAIAHADLSGPESTIAQIEQCNDLMRSPKNLDTSTHMSSGKPATIGMDCDDSMPTDHRSDNPRPLEVISDDGEDGASNRTVQALNSHR